MIKIHRHIVFYEKDGDKYIGEIPLRNIALTDLQSLVSIEKYKDDYLLYDCYFLDKSMLDKLAILDNQTFNLNLDSFEFSWKLLQNKKRPHNRVDGLANR